MFTIAPGEPGELPVFKVEVPDSSTVWHVGELDVLIHWLTGGQGGYVNIDLRKGTSVVDWAPGPIPNDGECTYDVPLDLEPGTDYRIRVQHSSEYFDLSDYFEIRCDPTPGPPELFEPIDGAQGLHCTPTFVWSSSERIGGYELMVADNVSLSSPDIHETDLANSSFTALNCLQNGAYYWRVRERNFCNNWSPWSAIALFSVLKKD